MKKLLLAATAALMTLTLVACTGQSSSKTSAKDNFISDYVSLNSQTKAYNARTANVQFKSFEATGSSAKELNKWLDNASLDIKMNIDYQNELADMNTSAKLVGSNYNLDLLFGSKGAYIGTAGIKELFNNNKASIPYSEIYGSLIDSLNTKYILLDSQLMEQSLASQGSTSENWNSVMSQMFQENKLNKEDVTNNFKDFPDADFSQSGDTVSMSYTANNQDIQKVLKASLGSQASLSTLLDSLQQNVDFQSLKVKTTLNAKTRETETILSGQLKDKQSDNSAKFEFVTTSKSEKSNSSLTEPASSDVTSLEQLLSGMSNAPTTDNASTNAAA